MGAARGRIGPPLYQPGSSQLIQRAADRIGRHGMGRAAARLRLARVFKNMHQNGEGPDTQPKGGEALFHVLLDPPGQAL